MTDAHPLGPIRATLDAMADRADLPALTGLVPGLTITETEGWVPASTLTSGERLDDMLAAAQTRWRASPHAAAALAWKSYTYWLALPAVLGYAAARRVPLLRPEHVLVRWSARQPFLVLGLASVEVAALPTDPLAITEPGSSRVSLVADERELLASLRSSMIDEHLAPMLDQIQRRLRIGSRTLWGSLASGVAHGFSRGAYVLPGSTLVTATEVLEALGVADLVDLAPAQHGRGLEVQRRTCCLAFTLPEPKVCAGCCIRRIGVE